MAKQEITSGGARKPLLSADSLPLLRGILSGGGAVLSAGESCSTGRSFEVWSRGSRDILLVIHPDTGGVDVLRPISGPKQADEVVTDILRYLGVVVPCGSCQDRPGKDGLGPTCKKCGGAGEVRA